jgi:DNA-binding HxlR family transcriptional regulator
MEKTPDDRDRHLSDIRFAGFVIMIPAFSLPAFEVRISALIQSPCVQILLFVYSKGEVRHSELERLIRSRGTLSSNLNDLREEGLLKRKVVTSKPIQTNYSLTETGRKIAETLSDLKNCIRSP